MYKNFKLYFFLFYLFLVSSLFAQRDLFQGIAYDSVYENKDLTINLDLIETTNIIQSYLFYRSFGKQTFSAVEMNNMGNRIVGTIPETYVTFPYIEYYIKLISSDGKEVLLPDGAPTQSNLYRINVKREETSDEEIIILSPDVNEPITIEEFFLAISFLRVSDKVKRELTKIFINEHDVSSYLLITTDIGIIPQGKVKNIFPGKNLLKVILYNNEGKPIKFLDYVFRIVTPKELEKISAGRVFKYNGIAQVESSNENLKSGKYNLNRLSMNFNSSYGIINTQLTLFLTNEEKPNIQPQNRYSFNLDAKWFKLSLGDHYPIYPSLIMGGKRLRGITATLETGPFNLQASFGEITRKIEGTLLEVLSREEATPSPDIIPVDSAKFGQPFARAEIGTFQRKLFVVRPYFGSGKNFQLGISYLHSMDNVNSIDFGARPKENVVIGSDLTIGIDNQRVLFRAQGAFSIINNDISLGNFSDKIIDSLFGEGKPLGGDPKTIKLVREIGKNFITVNQFIVPLNPLEFPTAALDAEFSLNYFGNYLKAGYVYRGNDYTSFGQNYIRTDIAGLRIMDRLSLVDNRVFISVSYENLSDNLQETKIATTQFKNFESSLSLYLRKNFPNMTLGYANFLVKNDIDPNTQDSVRFYNQLNNSTNQFSFSTSYDLKYLVLHRLFFNIVTSRKRDYTFKNLSTKFISINFSIQNFWRKNWHTLLGIVHNNSSISTSNFQYTSITVANRFLFLKDKLRVSFSLTPSFGNLKRHSLELGSQYFIQNNFTINFNFRFILNLAPWKNETIFSLVSRYEL